MPTSDVRQFAGNAPLSDDGPSSPGAPGGDPAVEERDLSTPLFAQRAERVAALAHHFGPTQSAQAASGGDWWATRPSVPTPQETARQTTLNFVDDFTLEQGQTLYFSAYRAFDAAYGWVRMMGQAAFTNRGTIVTLGLDGIGASATGTSAHSPVAFSWTNTATGSIYANAWPDVETYSVATGLYCAGSTNVTNAGLIQVTANRAQGIVTAGGSVHFTNEATGVLRVWADGVHPGTTHASGGYVPGRVVNAGLIEVSAHNRLNDAIGIEGSFHVQNSGTIRTHSPDVAVALLEVGDVDNSGRLEGTVAIWGRAGATTTVNNTGVIIGDIYGQGFIYNKGSITGDLYFYDINTTFDGRGGKLNGSIFLGNGTNTVHLDDTGGAVFTAAGGRNTLTGGAGDDLFDVIGGTNTINGGGGFDLVSYVSMSAGVSAALSGTGGRDALTGVEGLIGSAFADTLTGNVGNNYLEGGAGDDVLIAGGGLDVIDGGAGYDVLTFDVKRSESRLVTLDDDSFVLKTATGGIYFTGIEILRFSDGQEWDLRAMYGEPIPETFGTEEPLVMPLSDAAGGKAVGGGADDVPLVLPSSDWL